MPHNMNSLLASFHEKDALVCAGSEKSFEAYLGSASVLLSKIENSNDANVASVDNDFWFHPEDWRSAYRPYNVKDGVLYIPVKGVLLHGMGYALGDWATGYVYLTKAFERGLADIAVKRIVMVIDSGGGHVSGCFDLGDKIFAGRKVKPIHAVADEFAYSAAYLVASSATDFRVARTGGAGSIGVLRVHYDISKALDMEGVAVTFIQSGAHKTDGDPRKPLTAEVIARMEERSGELYDFFVSAVARNRSLDEVAVRETEAMTFSASEAVSKGLADSIGTLEDAIAAFAADMSNNGKDDQMFTQEQLDAAVASATASAKTEAHAEGKAEGLKEGGVAERARLSAIVNSEEGKKRPAMAMKMASGDKFAALDADTVTEMLADMPEEKASVTDTNATGRNFKATMDGTKNADLGAPGEGEQAEVPRHERALAIVKGPRDAA